MEVCLLLLLLAVTTTTAKQPIVVPIGGLVDAADPVSRIVLERAAKLFSSPQVELKPLFHNVEPSSAFNVSAAMSDVTFRKPSVVVLGTHDVSTADTVTSFADNYYLPYVTSSPTSELTQKDYVISLRPDVTRAVVDILSFYRWREVYYIYDDKRGSENGMRLMGVIEESASEINIHSHHVRSGNDVISYLKAKETELEHSNIRVILDIDAKCTNAVLSEMSLRPRNTRKKYSFFLRKLELNGLGLDHEAFREGMNIAGMTLIDRSHPVYLEKEYQQLAKLHRDLFPKNHPIQLEAAFLLDGMQVISTALNTTLGNDPHFQSKLRKLSRTSKNTQCLNEPLLNQTSLREHVRVNLKKVQIRGLTGRVAFDSRGQRTDYVLRILQSEIDNGPRQVATWTPSRRLYVNTEATRHRRQSDKRTLIVTSILRDGFLMLKKPNPSLAGNDRYEGYCVDLMNEVCRLIGEDCQIKLVKDNMYGAKRLGKWNGMIGELVRKEADMAVAPLTITSTRERVVDFSYPFIMSGIAFLTRKPSATPPAQLSFLAPFSTEVWLAIIGFFLLISFTLYGVSKCTENPNEDHLLVAQGRATTELNNSFWYSIGSLMLQSSEVMPRSIASRIVGAVWWMFCIVVLCSYAANLSAFLTVQSEAVPFRSFDQLAAQTKVKYGALQDGSIKEFFRSSRVAVYQRMWQVMNGHPDVFVYSTDYGVEKARKGGYAFLTEMTNADYFSARICDLMKVGGNVDPRGHGIATPLGSKLSYTLLESAVRPDIHLKSSISNAWWDMDECGWIAGCTALSNRADRINLAILELRESGTLQKLYSKWWFEKGSCRSNEREGKTERSVSALGLRNFTGLFMCAVVGVVLAIIVALLTILVRALQQSRRDKQPFMQSLRSQNIWRHRRPETNDAPEGVELEA